MSDSGIGAIVSNPMTGSYSACLSGSLPTMANFDAAKNPLQHTAGMGSFLGGFGFGMPSLMSYLPLLFLGNMMRGMAPRTVAPQVASSSTVGPASTSSLMVGPAGIQAPASAAARTATSVASKTGLMSGMLGTVLAGAAVVFGGMAAFNGITSGDPLTAAGGGAATIWGASRWIPALTTGTSIASKLSLAAGGAGIAGGTALVVDGINRGGVLGGGESLAGGAVAGASAGWAFPVLAGAGATSTSAALSLGVAGAGVGIGVFGIVDGYNRGSALGTLESTAGGALAGAAIGSIVPVVGTAIGAAVGGAVGLVAGLFGWHKNAALQTKEAELLPKFEAHKDQIQKQEKILSGKTAKMLGMPEQQAAQYFHSETNVDLPKDFREASIEKRVAYLEQMVPHLDVRAKAGEQNIKQMESQLESMRAQSEDSSASLARLFSSKRAQMKETNAYLARALSPQSNAWQLYQQALGVTSPELSPAYPMPIRS